MKQIASIAFAVAGLLPFSAAAQEGPIPEPKPLVARYTAQGGRLTVGGGPEAEQVAAVLKDRLTVRISGPTGAVPLLTQGTVLLAVLPRELTPIESAAVRRFSGGAPLAVPIM